MKLRRRDKDDIDYRYGDIPNTVDVKQAGSKPVEKQGGTDGRRTGNG